MNHLFNISTYEQIKSLWLNRLRESINLEFKSEISGNNNEIAKDISSFANASGGIIVYGVKEDNGRAVPSDGVIINKNSNNSDRIQQIISSTIEPPLEIQIIPVDVLDDDNNLIEDREFLIIRIPKSSFYIHQVTTTGKFYMRNNTITKQYKYEPQGLKEHDIALRYEQRFKDKVVQENIFDKKEKEIVGDMGYDSYFFIGAVPHVSVTPTGISKELFEELLGRYENRGAIYTIYEKLRDVSLVLSRPTGYGRCSKEDSNKKYLEINNDKTAYYTYSIEQEQGARLVCIWETYNVIDFLSMVNRMYQQVNHFSGITIVFKLCNVKGSKFRSTVSDEIDLKIPKDNIKIRKEINIIPFDVKKIAIDIFRELCENVGIDDVSERKKYDIDSIEKYVDRINSRLSMISKS